MSRTQDYANCSALEFNRTAAPILGKFCAPLRNFGITEVAYGKFFRDGKRLYLCSNHNWVELYLKHSFHNNLDHLEHYFPQADIQYALWSGFKRDSVFDAAYEFNICHGFTIYKRYADYIEYFDFGTTRENGQITMFYLNNIELLEKFVKSLKKELNNFLDHTDQRKIIVPQKLLPLSGITYTSFIKEEKVQNFLKQIDKAS